MQDTLPTQPDDDTGARETPAGNPRETANAGVASVAAASASSAAVAAAAPPARPVANATTARDLLIPAGAIPLPPPEPQRPNKRRQNRMVAMQFLYAWDIARPDNTTDAIYRFFTAQENTREFYVFAEELVAGTLEKLSEIDEAIRTFAENWKMHRIVKVDLAILRLAAYEMFYRPDIPPVVTINEAIELSKIFSSPESKRFINGMLDKIKEQLQRPAREASV